jgi:hypothetical protein
MAFVLKAIFCFINHQCRLFKARYLQVNALRAILVSAKIPIDIISLGNYCP